MVMLPIIFYNLVQHVIAGGVDRYCSGGGSPPARIGQGVAKSA
jgi:hypothetical protein